jgi:hypothetical protein
MGWWGLLPLAFIYFLIAGWLVKRAAYRGGDARLAACALIPPFFGYYMQTRGYFFQIFADCLFMVGPLFLMNLGMPRIIRQARRPIAGLRLVPVGSPGLDPNRTGRGEAP